MKWIFITFIAFQYTSYSYSKSYVNTYYNPGYLYHTEVTLGHKVCSKAIFKDINKIHETVLFAHQNSYRKLQSKKTIPAIESKVKDIRKAIDSLHAELQKLACQKHEPQGINNLPTDKHMSDILKPFIKDFTKNPSNKTNKKN